MEYLVSIPRDFSYADLQPTAEGDVNIRVLKLYPPPWYLRWLPRYLHFFIPLRGSLETISLKADDRPDYKALSYTWGPPDFTAEIFIDGLKLAITPSLALALLHLRSMAWPITIWIDQICINQKNDDEKGRQVKAMDKIYGSSEEALVWLGPRADGSDELMDVLIRMSNFVDEFKLLDYYTKTRFGEFKKIAANANPEDSATIQYHEFCDRIMPLFTHQFYTALIALYNRPWFHRAWVLQEFALAPEAIFVCGYKRIKAENFMGVLQIIQLTMISKSALKSPGDLDMTSLLERLNGYNTLQPFFSLRQRRKARDRVEDPFLGDGLYELLQRVHVGQAVQATKACDMVYGLLGLACDTEKLGKNGLQIAYNEAESQEDIVYTRTARALIKSGNIDILTLAQHMEKDFSLPSWVPDWRAHIQHSFAWLSDETADPLFSASGDMELEVVDDKEGRVLTLKGFYVDELEQVGEPWLGAKVVQNSSNPFPFAVYLNYLLQVRQMCQLSKAKGTKIYKSDERRDEAEWRVPVGDIEQNIKQNSTSEARRASPPWKKSYDKCLAELELFLELDAFNSLDEFKAREKEVEDMGGNSSFYCIRMQEMKRKRPFLSRMGYVGMSPTYTRPGDVIVVFCGASLPYIVRPVDGGRFRLMGECYCDGIMDGEFVIPKKETKKEDITLI